MMDNELYLTKLINKLYNVTVTPRFKSYNANINRITITCQVTFKPKKLDETTPTIFYVKSIIDFYPEYSEVIHITEIPVRNVPFMPYVSGDNLFQFLLEDMVMEKSVELFNSIKRNFNEFYYG